MPRSPNRLWPRDLNQMASGKPRAVQSSKKGTCWTAAIRSRPAAPVVEKRPMILMDRERGGIKFGMTIIWSIAKTRAHPKRSPNQPMAPPLSSSSCFARMKHLTVAMGSQSRPPSPRQAGRRWGAETMPAIEDEFIRQAMAIGLAAKMAAYHAEITKTIDTLPAIGARSYLARLQSQRQALSEPSLRMIAAMVRALCVEKPEKAQIIASTFDVLAIRHPSLSPFNDTVQSLAADEMRLTSTARAGAAEADLRLAGCAPRA
jgi:hypothetical protein